MSYSNIKLSLFGILQIPFCLFLGLGILPNLVLVIAVFKAKKYNQPGILLSAVNFYKYYIYLIGFLVTCIFGYVLYLKLLPYYSISPPFFYGYIIGGVLTALAIFLISLFFLEFLFKRPILLKIK